MTERFREFDAYNAEQEAEPIGFALRGSRRVVETAPLEEADGEPKVTYEPFRETFDCLPVCPGGVMNALGRGSGFLPFLIGVTVPEQRDRLSMLFDSPEHLIDHTVIADIADWLVEVYTGRPTKRPAASRNGSQKPGATSPQLVDSEGSTSGP